MSPHRLSAIIIAKNEEEDLPGCLLSLKGLAEEIVVIIDAESSDKTEDIARAHGCKILKRGFTSYAEQKQAALELATSDWVLSIDADERMSPLLKEEILRFISLPSEIDGVVLRFQIEFMGRVLKFGGVGHEKHLRLFRRLKGRFTGGLIHEGLEISGTKAFLFSGFVEHKPYKDLKEYLNKMTSYLDFSSQKGRQEGKRFHFWHHLILPWEIFSRLFLKFGILDGNPGIIWAALSAFHHWLKYVKLKELEIKENQR